MAKFRAYGYRTITYEFRFDVDGDDEEDAARTAEAQLEAFDVEHSKGVLEVDNYLDELVELEVYHSERDD